MGQVNVTISGRQYRMACEDGQEDHLFGLAQDIDGRIDRLRKAFGEIGDQRLTMMVAIMVADELHEASRSVATLKAELASLREVRARAAAEVEAHERAAAEALQGAAGRIERLAQSIATTPREGPGLG
jgi:cell division protein ZapA